VRGRKKVPKGGLSWARRKALETTGSAVAESYAKFTLRAISLVER